jgi:D-glycero-D-manno-heptose 1,7-bisphosphate phosphatase
MEENTKIRQKAIFLDRDGVINEDTSYPYKPEHIKFKKNIFKFCKLSISKGYIIVIITNQAGIAKGFFTEEDVNYLHQWMVEQFKNRGITITKIYYCPYHKHAIITRYRKDSIMRKPRPGLFLKAAKELNIEISKSFMIGDKYSDRIELASLRSIIIKSKYTQNGKYDVDDLMSIVPII